MTNDTMEKDLINALGHLRDFCSKYNIDYPTIVFGVRGHYQLRAGLVTPLPNGAQMMGVTFRFGRFERNEMMVLHGR